MTRMPNRFPARGALALSLLILVACQPPEPTAPATDGQHGALDQAELDRATYAGLGDEPVTLTDGEWTGEPFTADGASRPRAGLVTDFRLDGDLDNDGDDETVVLLWTSGGGSGTYDFVAVMDRGADGGPVNLGTAPLGDRVRVRSGKIVGGAVVLEVVQAGPQDAACCPGQRVRRTFTLQGNALIEEDAEDLGRVSTADLAGVEWVLQSMAGESLPDGVEVTLTVAGDRISGVSGCNLYAGAIDAGDGPGRLSLRLPMIGTRMACPPPADAVEQRYLQTLGAVTQYALRAGQLRLTAVLDGEVTPLLFTERPL